jgi:hypothetical protein
MLLSFGLTAFAATGEDLPPLPPFPEDMRDELYPADVQTVIDDNGRQIVRTYILTAEQDPADFPRASFIRDGWMYTLTDITQQRTSETDTRSHTETVTINTDTNDLHEIIKQLSPTLEYLSQDGYRGILTLDLTSVNCEAAGHRNSSYTVTATREYPHLSENDLSLIPKTITDNNRTLELDSVTWEVQQHIYVDYHAIPYSYRAIAKYTATASRRVVTGYVTAAEYRGEIAKTVTGDTIYKAYFEGAEINPEPTPEPSPEPTPTAEPIPAPVNEKTPVSTVPLLIGIAITAALLGGVAVYFFLRHNVKVYSVRGDGYRVLVAKVRISVKNPVIDLTPLDRNSDSKCFDLEIDRFAASALNKKTVTVICGSKKLEHRIAYEGNTYRIEVDFNAATIRAIY